MITLKEATRIQLATASKNAGPYKDQSHGKNRFERKKLSKVINSVKAFNDIDMNSLFKQDTLVVGIPIAGETNNYTVTVKFDGLMTEIARSVKSNNYKFEYKNVIQSLTKMFNTRDVYVNCTCPDFTYRFAHWSVVNGFGTLDSAHDPGPGKGIANPDDSKGRGCKHVLLILNNGDWLMKVASVISNYIHYMADHKDALFYKLIFPKLYGMPADEMIDQDLIDDEKFLDSSKGIIDAINQYAKDRGKIKKGTNRNTLKDKEDAEANDIKSKADELAKKQELETKKAEEEQKRLDKINKKAEKASEPSDEAD